MAVVVTGKRKLTYEEYALLPDDRNRHEIIDGDHYVSPAPLIYHQDLAARLYEILRAAFVTTGRGRVLFAPVDVELTVTDIVQPDLIVVLAEHGSIVTRSRIIGAPDLLVEIVSPSNRRHDTVLKLDLYRRAGVGEYWIVDPEARRMTVYARSPDGLTEHDAGGGRVTSPLAGGPVEIGRIW